MRLLCKFLGVRFGPTMLEFYKSDEARRAAESSELWGNVSKPIMAGNTRKFLREVGESDIRIFEYDCLYVPAGEKKIYSQEEIRQFETENLRLKEEVLQRTSGADLERRDRQAGLIQEIRNRGQMSPPSLRAIA